MTMKVNEVFFSIQGESSFMGCPCAFIRTTACNLRCSYCDTAYAFSEGREMPIADILDALQSMPTRLVLVTGGEPMLQKDIGALFEALLGRGYTVCLETGGHMPLQDVDARVHKIMDWKCPSSGMQEHNHYDNIRHLTRIDEVKFVLGNREDFDWACRVVAEYELTARVGAVLFSPVYHVLPYDDLARWILESGLPVRMQLQLHKIIWPGVLRGV
jgi:7-carboxy-7-deazaguanine synthase